MNSRKLSDFGRHGNRTRGRGESRSTNPELVSLHTELVALFQRSAALADWARAQIADGTMPLDVERSAQDTADEISDRCAYICAKMVLLPATSLEELNMKAAAFEHLCPEDSEPHLEMARSIFDDLKRLAS